MLKHLLEKTDIFPTIFGQNFRIKVTAARVALVRNVMRENADQNNSEYGQFLRSDEYTFSKSNF